MDLWRETEGKLVHDALYTCRPYKTSHPSDKTMTAVLETGGEKCVMAPGPIIVGAGPSGLAVAACLRRRGIPSLVIERSSCIASLWKLKSYDRLRLHLPKQFCELPLMPFPDGFPTYPTKQEFLHYLDTYAKRFDIRPVFAEAVVNAEYDEETHFWRIWTAVDDGGGRMAMKAEYASPWLVVATGENAEAVVPTIDGAEEFKGSVLHTSSYKSGMEFYGKRVLVVGCGNSGMEVCLDLHHHEAMPSLVVRDAVHVLPREMLGGSTFGLSMWLLKWLPVRAVDRLLLLVSRLMLGDTARLGLKRPQLGPLELKALCGKTPVLDVGTLAKIKSGDIKVRPPIRRLTEREAEFIDGRLEEFDVIILATGYKSNVPSWLKESGFFSEKDGLPMRPFPNGWRGERGLYAVGFTKRGLLGASMDAIRIAEDIDRSWTTEEREQTSFFSRAKLHANKNGD